MSDIKTFLQESELATYNKSFPTLTVPTLGADAEGYMKNIAEAAIEQIKFMNSFAGIPLDVLYENVGQRHKSSNLLALSMLRKRSQDTGTTSRGLDLIDVPDDETPGDYSNAFLPAKLGKQGGISLSKGLIALITNLIGTFTGSKALTAVLELIELWFQEGGFLQEVAMSVIDNLIEGIVTLLVQKILGREQIIIGDGSEALVPYLSNIVTALQANNYATEATALVQALSQDGALVKQLKDCCPKDALDKLVKAFYLNENDATLEKMVKALYVTEERHLSGDIIEIVETGLAQRVHDIEAALRRDVLFVRTGEEPEAGQGEEQQKTAYTQAVIDRLKDWCYQTETLEIGGIRLALRANIIQQA